jgi:molybdenum cofactor cytidylyltransferase
MGRPKALLPAAPGGPTFVAALAAALGDGGVTEILVVGRPDDQTLKSEVERLARPSRSGIAGNARIRFVDNLDADTGQLSSIIAGLDAAERPAIRGLLVMPVDMPLVGARSVSRVIEAFASAGDASIVRAVHAGTHGHPVVFGRAFFDALRAADRSVGARAVLRAHPQAVVDVEVGDPGVALDIDTPGDYRRIVGPLPE